MRLAPKRRTTDLLSAGRLGTGHSVRVTTGRLNSMHPSVDAALADVPQDRLADVVRTVAAAAVHATGIIADCEAATDPAALVETLDEAAWTAQEVDDDAYVAAFCRARAADARARSMTVADRESAAEALYEAIHALGGDQAAEQTVVCLMRT